MLLMELYIVSFYSRQFDRIHRNDEWTHCWLQQFYVKDIFPAVTQNKVTETVHCTNIHPITK